jgi:hypothetical protein
MEITISRKVTLNTGNYSSITPSVSVTLEIDENEPDKYHKFSKTLEDLFNRELAAQLEIQSTFKSLGVERVKELLQSKLYEV